MDPDKSLSEVLELFEEIRGGNNNAREDAAELLEALANWLRRGGFAPDPGKLKGGSP